MPNRETDEREQVFLKVFLKGSRRIGRGALILLIAVLVAGMTLWGTLFLWLSDIPGAAIRGTLAALFGIGTLASFAFLKRRLRTLLVFAVVSAALMTWFFSIPPSNDRDWAPEVAVLPEATVDGNKVEIRNIRNFEYRSETDFTPRYYDKTFDLDKLQSVDLICVYWGDPDIAHIITSFGFGDDEYVAFSIEMRKERGEPTTTLRSLFRKYELIYVVADERDLIGVRTDFREPREDVYLYRSRLPAEARRQLFLAYVARVNDLAQAPEWYNTLEHNCTTGVVDLTQSYQGRARHNWKTLLSGHVPEYAYELGTIDTSIPFAELREDAYVNPRAPGAGRGAYYSARIREGIPMPEPYTVEEFRTPR